VPSILKTVLACLQGLWGQLLMVATGTVFRILILYWCGQSCQKTLL